MRGVKWLLATCGIVGMILGVSAAQDIPNFDIIGPTNGPAADTGVPSQYYSRRAADRTDDVLQKDTAQSVTEAAAAVPADRSTATIPGSPEKYTRDRRFPLGERIGQGSRQNYLDRLFRAAAGEAGSESPEMTPRPKFTEGFPQVGQRGRVQRANYERTDGTSEGGRIIQAGATDDNVSPFAASADEPGVETPRAFNPLPLPDPETGSNDASATAVPKTTVSIPVATATAPVVVASTGPQTSQLTIQWVKQSDINVGQECRCQLRVTNSGKLAAKNVTVDAFFPNSVRLIDATPAPASATDHLTWRFAELKPGQRQVIEIRLIPSERGALKTSAFVSFTAATSSIFTVTEPLLAIQIEGPKDVLVGEPASQVIKMSNPGSGVATNVKLEAVVPAGLEHLRGERLSMEIGSLNPGETRVVRLALGAITGGDQTLNFQVVADGGLSRVSSKTITVVAPTLAAKLSGPLARYVGHSARYSLTVNNESSVASNNVRATYKIPAEFKFVRADSGGRYDSQSGQVSWFIGRLEPGKSVSRSVFLTAVEAGAVVHNVAITSEHGTSAQAELATTIDATAKLVLEIVEQADPVQIGLDTGFEVRVRNDGSKAASNVGLSIELPVGVKYLSARGPSEFLAENGLLLFKSIGHLDPGKTAVYQILVRGTAAGSHRIRARVASDSIGEPLIGEETTEFRAE